MYRRDAVDNSFRGTPVYLDKSGKQKRRSSSTTGAELLALRAAHAAARYVSGFAVGLGLTVNSTQEILLLDMRRTQWIEDQTSSSTVGGKSGGGL